MEIARLSLRADEEKRAVSKIEDAYGSSYDDATMREAKDRVMDLLGEEPVADKPRSLRRDFQQAQEKVKQREKESRQIQQKQSLKDREL